VTATILLGFVGVVHAQFDIFTEELILNNTLPDNDYNLLTQFAGFNLGDTLSLSMTGTSNGWQTSLTGTYLGTNLNVNYSGTITSGGLASWTSSGTYGASTWTGSGTAQFSQTSSNTFQLIDDSELSLDENTSVLHITNSGSFNGQSVMYTGTTGTETLNGNAVALKFNTLFFTNWPPKAGDTFWDDIDQTNGTAVIVSTGVVASVASQGINYSGTLTTVQGFTAEDVLTVMQLEADASLDNIAATIYDYSGVIDVGATMQYNGEYDFAPSGGGAYSGTFTGQMTGNYLSDPYTLTYSATFAGDDIIVTSTGKWGTDEHITNSVNGKPFTDSATLTNSATGLEGTITITTGTNVVTIPVSLTKTINGGIITAKGSITVNSNTEDVTIIFDAAAKTLTSKVISGPWYYKVTVLTNTGTYTVSNTTSGHTTGSLNFNITVEPPVSAFTINAFSLQGTNAIMTAIGPPGTNCCILSSTNLATPLANWTVLATNTFDGDGSFSFTNVIAPDCPERFYLLSAR
jgi:hypothetical protein